MSHLIAFVRGWIGISTRWIGKGLLLSSQQLNEVAVSSLDSTARLQALHATKLLDSPPEHAFDRLTALACRFVRAPIALISLVDAKRQFFKSNYGLPEPLATQRETPLSHSFCQHVVTSQQPLVIEDAREDERVCDNLAIRDFDVIAYLGIPLITGEGQVLGSLCVIDHSPRQWLEDDVKTLSELAALVMTEIELRHYLHKQQQAEQKLRYYSHLLENIYDAVIATDPQFQITAWNPGAEQMYGWPASAVMGRLVTEVIHPMLSDELLAQATHLLNNIGRCRVVLQTQHKEGALIDTEAVAVVLRAEEDQITGYLSINRDIAERKRYELILQELNVNLEQQVAERTAELKRSNRELDQFAYIASHDLKSPLRAINHLANWISEDAHAVLPPATQQHLSKLHNRVNRMERLLDDLLAYSRAGRIQYQQETVQLEALFQNLIEWLAPPAGFTITLPDQLPTLITARVPLETVLRNLLSNAIKHHHNPDEGHVDLSVELAGEWVTFRISDNGPGIDPSYYERIFQIFQTLRPRDEIEGSGIGLAVVKKTVESYGGTIQVESQLDRGTTFRFTWPKEPLVSGDDW